MPQELYKELDKTCPVCGMLNVWLCTARDCPKGEVQAQARKQWVNLSTNPVEEEDKSSKTP